LAGSQGQKCDNGKGCNFPNFSAKVV